MKDSLYHAKAIVLLQEVIETILLLDDGDIRAQVFLVVAKKLAKEMQRRRNDDRSSLNRSVMMIDRTLRRFIGDREGVTCCN